MLLKAKKEANRRMAFGFRTEYPVSDSYKFDMIYISCVSELVVQEYLNNKKARVILLQTLVFPEKN